MTAPSDFNSISELDATLVFRVAYDGSSYSGFGCSRRSQPLRAFRFASRAMGRCCAARSI